MSDETIPTAPKKRGRKPKVRPEPDVISGVPAVTPPSITVAPRADESQWSTDDIIARRLNGEAFGLKVERVPLREPQRWQLHIATSGIDPSRHYEMIHRHGWVPCTTDDLTPGVPLESIGWRLGEDGRTLVRGVRGEEVLYKMDAQIFRQIQRKKAEKNVESMRSPKAAREEAANAAAAAHGDQAAEYLAKHTSITITDSQQRLGS